TAGGNGVLVVAFDSTKRKLDEERLALAHAELREQKEAAERGSLAKSRFLAAASHDLRQPLHALSLFASELEAVAQPAQRRLVQQLGTAAESMHEMLAALLDISRIDLAGLEPKVLSFPLAPFLEKILAGHIDQARRKNLRIALVPCSVWARSDPRLLERIVANLLSNAIRYTAEGAIAMGVRRAGDNLRLEIWDTGIGMEERHIPLVFQEFYQVANPERDARKGLGLGLSIVDRLAQALAHPIKVRSVPGRGSVFSVELPRALPQSPAPSRASAREAEAHSEVLVVAPADQERSRLCDKLIEWGIHVTAVANPAEALRTAAGAALIICDDSMLDILAAQMSASGLPPPPLLVIGNPAGKDAATHIVKPVRPAKLRALLQHLLPDAFSTTDG
ncbi:MAG: hybrid sensor histidine kinase/response regulator, partial [Rhodocyclaceae bacterium]|nr:hybrid sensor histidine kinase/response regulator [Rhodocyclaceae bacterium]